MDTPIADELARKRLLKAWLVTWLENNAACAAAPTATGHVPHIVVVAFDLDVLVDALMEKIRVDADSKR